jgi:hypothetical protein
MAEDIKTTDDVATETAKASAQRKTTAAKAPAKRKTAAKKPAAGTPIARKKFAKKAAAAEEVAQGAASKLAGRAQEASRQALLASLGFYGKAFDQLQDQFSGLQERLEQRREQASDLYAELVKRGEKVEADAREAFEGIDISSLRELTDREALEARLEKGRARFIELKESFGFKTAA